MKMDPKDPRARFLWKAGDIEIEQPSEPPVPEVPKAPEEDPGKD